MPMTDERGTVLDTSPERCLHSSSASASSVNPGPSCEKHLMIRAATAWEQRTVAQTARLPPFECPPR